jgi:glyoxylase-like metal-dependent hydrolase (beta-lactamase superfamily II)
LALVDSTVLILILYASDLLGHGTAVFEDLATYLATLEKMHDRAVGRAYPGHGDIIKDSRAKVMEYIQHRQQRENEVLRILKFGALDVNTKEASPGSIVESWSPLELVRIIYRDVSEDLHLPASHGVIQVLVKLENEGKVIHDAQSGRWSIRLERPTL